MSLLLGKTLAYERNLKDLRDREIASRKEREETFARQKDIFLHFTSLVSESVKEYNSALRDLGSALTLDFSEVIGCPTIKLFGGDNCRGVYWLMVSEDSIQLASHPMKKSELPGQESQERSQPIFLDYTYEDFEEISDARFFLQDADQKHFGINSNSVVEVLLRSAVQMPEGEVDSVISQFETPIDLSGMRQEVVDADADEIDDEESTSDDVEDENSRFENMIIQLETYS